MRAFAGPDQSFNRSVFLQDDRGAEMSGIVELPDTDGIDRKELRENFAAARRQQRDGVG